MTKPLTPAGTDPLQPEIPFHHHAIQVVRDEFGVAWTLMRRLTSGPPEAGVGVIVLAAAASLIYLRDLIGTLEGVTTLFAVLTPDPADTTTDDVQEYVNRLVQPLRGTWVHTLVGHSVAAYLAASIATAQAAQQARPPQLVLLEPPTRDDLMNLALSDLLLMPEVVLQRFTAALKADSLSTAPRGTAAFRRQIVEALLTHRGELESALESVDPAALLAPPELALDVYPEWADWLGLAMQLCTEIYSDPVVCIEGADSAKMEASARACRFALIRDSFPQARFQETNLEHGDLLGESILLPHFAPQLAAPPEPAPPEDEAGSA